MISEEPKVHCNGRYGKCETATLLGICRNSLTKYTNEGYIRCGYRKATKRVFYKGSEILRFWNMEIKIT